MQIMATNELQIISIYTAWDYYVRLLETMEFCIVKMCDWSGVRQANLGPV